MLVEFKSELKEFTSVLVESVGAFSAGSLVAAGVAGAAAGAGAVACWSVGVVSVVAGGVVCWTSATGELVLLACGWLVCEQPASSTVPATKLSRPANVFVFVID